MFLLVLCACGDESAQTDQPSEGGQAVTAAALASDAGAGGGGVATNPDADAMVTAPVADDSNARPVLERRVSTSAQAVVGRAAPRGTDAQRAAGQNQGDDADDENDDDEPRVDPREQRLAWLAEEWVGQDLPAQTAHASGGGSVARIVVPEEPMEFVRPDAVRGIYVNAWAAGSSVRSQALIDLATRTELNAFVIDLKDATGYVSYATEVMMAREVVADQDIRIRDLVGLLERLQEADIYPRGR